MSKRIVEETYSLFSESAALNLRIPDDADQRSGMMPITVPF